MTSYCEKFTGGWCTVVEKYVSRSWCQQVCRGDYKGKRNEPSINYPSAIKQGITFAKAAVTHVVTGMRLRSEEDQVACMAICKACDFFVEQTKHGPRCQKCGCRLKVKNKWKVGQCPEGKW